VKGAVKPLPLLFSVMSILYEGFKILTISHHLGQILAIFSLCAEIVIYELPVQMSDIGILFRDPDFVVGSKMSAI